MGSSHAYTVIDVETTGLDPARDRIVELALVLLDADGHELGGFDTMVDPGSVHGAREIHRLAPEALALAPAFIEVAGEVASVLQGSTLVAHYAKFDLSFLHAEFDRAGMPLPELGSICTIEAARAAGLAGPYGLDSLAGRVGIELGTAHEALADARACAELFRLLLATGRIDPPELTRSRHVRPAGAGFPPASVGPPTDAGVSRARSRRAVG